SRLLEARRHEVAMAGPMAHQRLQQIEAEADRQARDPATDSPEEAKARAMLTEEREHFEATLQATDAEQRRASAAYDVATAYVQPGRSFGPGTHITDAQIYGTGGETAATGGMDPLLGVPGPGHHGDETLALYEGAAEGIDTHGNQGQ